MFAALLDDLRAVGHDIATMVFTLDALHTQHSTASLLEAAGAGYVMTVKGNQPKLRAAIIDQLRDQDRHGPGSTRVVTAAQRNAGSASWPATGIDFPGAQQVFRIVRYTGGLDANASARTRVRHHQPHRRPCRP